MPTATFTGQLIKPPSWYDTVRLPQFYRQSNGDILIRPLNNVPDYTNNDVLDLLLYYQTIIGDNRTDFKNSANAAWTASNGSSVVWAQCAFKTGPQGNGGGNWAAVPSHSIDRTLENNLSVRAVVNWQKQYPWVVNLKGELNILSLPEADSTEIARPSWLPASLPSLLVRPNGNLTTRFKVKSYTIDNNDIAAFMLYMQPIVANGATPYTVNWYIDANLCGAQYVPYFIGFPNYDPNTHFSSDFMFAGGQLWYMFGSEQENSFSFPSFAIPRKPTAIDDIANIAVAIVKKVPVVGSLYGVVSNLANSLNQGAPPGTIAAEVAQAATTIAKGIDAQQTQNTLAVVKTQDQKQTEQYIMYAIIVAVVIVIIISIVKRK